MCPLPAPTRCGNLPPRRSRGTHLGAPTLGTRSDAWQASITTWLEGGEQMSNLAADLREFLPSPV